MLEKYAVSGMLGEILKGLEDMGKLWTVSFEVRHPQWNGVPSHQLEHHTQMKAMAKIVLPCIR